jgi:putative ATP-dependent endonuclease of OLD family
VVRVRRLTITNFRGVANGTVDFHGHTLLVGGNNVGKSTICDALELVLGAERLFRRPIIDEHDFLNGQYLDGNGNRIEIKIEAVLIDLPEETQRKLFSKTRPWSDQRGGFVDTEGATPTDLDGADVCRALPVVFIGWYDRENDDFCGQTFFTHPEEVLTEDDDNYGKPRISCIRAQVEARLRLHLSPHTPHRAPSVESRARIVARYDPKAWG